MKVLSICMLALAGLPFAAGTSAQGGDEALVLGAGSVARREMIAIGRDLVIEGQAHSDVAVVRGDLMVSGKVEGDVIALGGDIILAPRAEVGGDAQALGGHVEMQPGARVAGRVAAYPRLPSALLALFDGPAVGHGWLSPTLLWLKLGLAAAWVLWACLCAAFAPRSLRRTAVAFSVGPLRLFAIGSGVVLTVTLFTILLAALMPLAAAVPLLLLCGAVLMGLKLWGVAALSLVFGRFLIKLGSASMPLILGPVLLGMIALNLLRFVPMLGVVAWAAFSLVGIGAVVHDRVTAMSATPAAASG